MSLWKRYHRSCHTCDHRERQQIDRRLAAGERPAHLALEYRLSKDSVRRHKANHLGHLVAASLRGEYAGDVSAVRSMTFKSRSD